MKRLGELFSGIGSLVCHTGFVVASLFWLQGQVAGERIYVVAMAVGVGLAGVGRGLVRQTVLDTAPFALGGAMAAWMVTYIGAPLREAIGLKDIAGLDVIPAAMVWLKWLHQVLGGLGSGIALTLIAGFGAMFFVGCMRLPIYCGEQAVEMARRFCMAVPTRSVQE